MARSEQKKYEKFKHEFELWLTHKNSSDFVNSGSLFDQRLVSAYFASNLSLSLVGAKFSKDETHDQDNTISLQTGALTNWRPDQAAYQDYARQRSVTITSGSTTYDLKEHRTLNIAASGVLAPSDGKGPTVSYLNTEVKLGHLGNFVGVGGIVGENVTKNQAYVMGQYQGAQMNLGVYEMSTHTHAYGFRTMASYDWKINDNNKLQLFASLEIGPNGEKREGAIYETKVGNVKVRADAIVNTASAHGIENLNVKAEMPVAVRVGFDHGHGPELPLNGTLYCFAGIAGPFVTDANPAPALAPVYGVGAKLNLYNNKNHRYR